MMIRVVMMAAMPQEARPLLKLLGASHRLAGEPFPTWFRRSPHVELLLVETGMGGERAARAARHVLAASRVDLLVSVGFAGSLWPGFRLGQVVCSRELAAYDGRSGDPPPAAFRHGPASRLTDFCQAYGVQRARFLSVDRVWSKAEMVGRFVASPAVLEMESTAVAAEACRRGVAFLGLRAISDEATQEIALQPASVLDGTGRVSVPRVVGAVLRRPILMGSLLRLWRGSGVAGRGLAATLVALLQLPEEDLRALAGQLQLLPPHGGRARSDA